MSVPGKLFFLTIISWIPILLLFYLPNTFWGIGLKILAGIFLASLEYSLTIGPLSRLVGPAGPGFVMIAILYAITNFNIPSLVSYLIWALIILCWMTNYKVLKKVENPQL